MFTFKPHIYHLGRLKQTAYSKKKFLLLILHIILKINLLKNEKACPLPKDRIAIIFHSAFFIFEKVFFKVISRIKYGTILLTL